MDKAILENSVQACRETTKNALQTVYDTLNQGQQKKLLKYDNVKALFDLYEVNYNG